MSTTEHSPEELLDLLGDDLVRRIFLLTSNDSMSADALANDLDVSHPTVYRRVNTLVEYGLLQEDLVTDSDGHHYKTFALALTEMTVRVEDGRLEVTVGMDETLVDRFDGFLAGLDVSYSRTSGDPNEQPKGTHSRGDSHYG